MDEYLTEVTLVHLGYVRPRKSYISPARKDISDRFLCAIESRRFREYYFRPGAVEVRFLPYIWDIIENASSSVFEYVIKTFAHLFHGITITYEVDEDCDQHEIRIVQIGYGESNVWRQITKDMLAARGFVSTFNNGKEVMILENIK